MFKKLSLLIGIFTLLICAFLLSGCSGHLAEVIKYDSSNNAAYKTKDGIFYSLPKNIVRVEVPIKRTEKSKADLLKKDKENYEWGLEQLELTYSEMTTKDKTEYSLGDPVISTITKPDSDNTFFVKLDTRYIEDSNLTLELTRDGLIKSGKSDVSNKTWDIGVKGSGNQRVYRRETYSSCNGTLPQQLKRRFPLQMKRRLALRMKRRLPLQQANIGIL